MWWSVRCNQQLTPSTAGIINSIVLWPILLSKVNYMTCSKAASPPLGTGFQHGMTLLEGILMRKQGIQ